MKKINEIDQKLIDMEQEDQDFMQSYHRAAEEKNETQMSEISANHQAAQVTYKDFILKNLPSWEATPTEQLGTGVVASLFFLVQHLNELDLFLRILPIIKDAMIKDIIDPRIFALLSDRIRLRQKLPQLYGTQRIGKTNQICQFQGTCEEVEARRIIDRVNTEQFPSFKFELIKYGIVPPDFDFTAGKIPTAPIA